MSWRHAIALITMISGAGAAPVRADDDPARIAREILDDARPRPEREALVRDHPALSAELIRAMTADLEAGTREEYRRIPWVWRVAIAAGKRNDPGELRKILDAALPAAGGRLDDWRAVVVGGGLVNGITQAGAWPGACLRQVVKGDRGLEARWEQVIRQAVTMSDDERVPTGTRYDALRILGVEPWDRHGAQLFRYLVRGVHPELQMGAVSGLGDVPTPSPVVAQALLSGVGHYNATNLNLALDALLRDEARALALLDAVADGRLKRAALGEKREAALKTHDAESVRRRAAEVLRP